MRILIRITPDVEKANATISNGTFGRLLQQTLDRAHPETAFFFTEGGYRTASFICDVADQSEMPSIAEPWFSALNAKVEFFPCMNVEDLKRGLDKLASAKEYAATP